ncbi:MAG: ThuA domain-containing protein [Pseudomonadota bacterium]
MNITVWNEYIHERNNEAVAALYPQGIHEFIAAALRTELPEAQLRTATLEQPEHGLSQAVLDETDVLFWWGHLAHHKVDDAIVQRVQARVLQGMGLVVLHSAHLSKIFTRLMGTTCNLRWREADDRELVWTVNPSHPIAQGVRQPIVLAQHEMYGEYFDIPAPDELVFISAFSGGEVFRSGCCFNRGKGRVFYFSPGHETYPVYHQPEIIQVLVNAARWAHQPQVTAIETQHSPSVETGWWA